MARTPPQGTGDSYITEKSRATEILMRPMNEPFALLLSHRRGKEKRSGSWPMSMKEFVKGSTNFLRDFPRPKAAWSWRY